jgi:hypothetical protein
LRNHSSTGKPIKRLNLFNQAIMFFTRTGWLGLKARKHARSHLLAGFTSKGLAVHETVEDTGLHIPLADIPINELKEGLSKFLFEIFRGEIDPTDSKHRDWAVLIPKTTSPDSLMASKLFIERGREASLTLEPLIKMGPSRALHELFDIIPMVDVQGRRFKYALAYPTWKFTAKTQRWLFERQGHYFVISEYKRRKSFRKLFGAFHSDRVVKN